MSAPSTVAELLDGRAADTSAGVVDADTCWTWAEVVERTDAVAAWLRSVPGDGPFHVGVLMENTPAHLLAMLGAARAGPRSPG